MSQVYISCSVILCEAGNPDTRCSEGCIDSTQPRPNHRQRREAAIQTERHYISQGPLRLRRSSGITGDSETFLKYVMNGLLAAAPPQTGRQWELGRHSNRLLRWDRTSTIWGRGN